MINAGKKKKTTLPKTLIELYYIFKFIKNIKTILSTQTLYLSVYQQLYQNTVFFWQLRKTRYYSCLSIAPNRHMAMCRTMWVKSPSRVRLCDPTDYTVHEILQARILEWVAFPLSRGSSQSRDRTQVSRIVGRFFTNWATRQTCRTMSLVQTLSLYMVSLFSPFTY